MTNASLMFVQIVWIRELMSASALEMRVEKASTRRLVCLIGPSCAFLINVTGSRRGGIDFVALARLAAEHEGSRSYVVVRLPVLVGFEVGFARAGKSAFHVGEESIGSKKESYGLVP